MKSFLVVVVFSFCWFLTESASHRFQVESRREANVWSHPKTEAAAVNFTLYHEFLCPYCRAMYNEQVAPTFRKISSIMNFELVPYGNAREKKVGDKWIFTCQHRFNECLGNLIETCAIDILGGISGAFPFISCLEKSDVLDPSITGPQCAEASRIDYRAILDCVNGPLGNRLEHEMAVKTESLNPPLRGVPWVTLNGVFTEDIWKRAATDLLGLICDTYTGIKPEACKKEAAD